jgi:uncharacterized protein YbaR (Trm112 family)
MNIKLMKIICCPVCKNELIMDIINQTAEEIIEGTLYCKNCDFSFPIEKGIPNLLPPEFNEHSNSEDNG